jgi:hypothetical protein
MGASGRSPRGRGRGAGVVIRPGEGGERSIGEEPQDGVGSRAQEKEVERVRASGSLLAGDLTTTLRASQSSPGMETRAGEAPWDAALASSIAVMALTMTVGSRSGSAVARLSECS